MRKTTVHFSANFSRFLILLLVIGMLATCFTGCFTYDPLGKENEGNNGPAFDPDGDDEPDQPTEPTDSTQSTDATTGTEPVSGTENTAPTQPPATEPTQPATQPTEPPTQPTQPTQPPVYADPIARGMVTATELNIRKGPGTGYDKAGAYKFNTRVTIYARNGKWGQTKDGWISMDYVYVDGTVGNMNSEKGTLTGDYVNVRSGPGTEYGVVRSTREGDRVTVLHKVTISGMDWYCLADGWIAAKYVQLDKDKPAETEPTTPATEPTETTAATEPAATDPVTTDPPATDPVTTDPTNPTP
mgnify:CR=1 FL=1